MYHDKPGATLRTTTGLVGSMDAKRPPHLSLAPELARVSASGGGHRLPHPNPNLTLTLTLTSPSPHSPIIDILFDNPITIHHNTCLTMNATWVKGKCWVSVFIHGLVIGSFIGSSFLNSCVERHLVEQGNLFRAQYFIIKMIDIWGDISCLTSGTKHKNAK